MVTLELRDPVAGVLGWVRKERADLVVVGSRGFGRIKGLILGSVSQKIVQESECPCLVVK